MREQARADALDTRYGRTSRTPLRSWWWVVIALALAVLAVVWYVWAGPGSAPPSSSVHADVSSSNVIDEHHIGVTFTVSAPVHQAVVCAVNAKSEDFSIVGWKIVHLAASDAQSRTRTETLKTTSMSTAGFVDSCWLS